MKRRQFLNAATALAAGGSLAATPVNAQSAADSANAAENEAPTSAPTVFGFEEVAQLAAERATRVYTQPVAEQEL